MQLKRGDILRPQLHRAVDGGWAAFGPLQLNWYNGGLRVYLTWPRRGCLTLR